MLVSQYEFRIKFNEVDALGIVWHGHYVRFFEDGREAFGHDHGLTYLDIYKKGFVAPVVKLQCDYKKSLEYDDVAVVETTFINSPAAKIIFNYTIFLKRTMEVVATGSTTQVFIDSKTRELQLFTPGFIQDWKKSNQLV